MKTEDAELLWESFGGHIYCINLLDRNDRYVTASKFFREKRIPVKFFRTRRHATNGGIGCFESHITVIKNAYDQGAERVLIFEDDVTSTQHLTFDNLRKAMRFMKARSDWSLFYLGAVPVNVSGCSNTEHDGIYSGKFVGAHAYVVNRPAMKLLKDMKFTGKPIDVVYQDHMKGVYALYPAPFIQVTSDTSVTKGTIWQKMTSERQKRIFLRGNEIYAYYVGMPLKSFGLFLLIVLVIIVLALVLLRRRRRRIKAKNE